MKNEGKYHLNNSHHDFQWVTSLKTVYFEKEKLVNFELEEKIKSTVT